MSAEAETVEARREPSSVKLAGTLAFAGLLSGLALVMVYQGTLPTIEANKAEALQKAVFKVVPGSTKMQKLVPAGGTLKVAAPGDRGEGVYAAYDQSSRLLGYAISGAGAGFQDTIELIYGFDPAKRRIIGMWVLESRETPGLGDKIYKDAHFVGNFSALAVEPPVVAVKKGTKSKDNEVDAITGATISSKAVVKIINDTNARWLPKLPAPGGEPPYREHGGK